MNILVAGGAGFIGHQLVRMLLENPQHQITVIDNFSFGDRSLLPISPHLEILPFDLRNRKEVFEVLKGRSFDAAYHLAAIHFIPYCNEHPDEALETNVWGTKNITERSYLRPSVEAVREMIDWEPKYRLEQTLRELLEESGLMKCE